MQADIWSKKITFSFAATASKPKFGDTVKKSALGDIKNVFQTPSQPKEESSKMVMKSVPQLTFGQRKLQQLQKEAVFDNDLVDDRTASSKPLDWCWENEVSPIIPLPDFYCMSPRPPPSPTESDFGDLGAGDFLFDEEPQLLTPPRSFYDDDWFIDSPFAAPRAELNEDEVLPVRSLSWLDEYFEKFMGREKEE